MTQVERLRERLKAASPAEAQTIRDLIATLERGETAPDIVADPSPDAAPRLAKPDRDPLWFMNAEQVRLWRPIHEGRARVIVLDEPKREVE